MNITSSAGMNISETAGASHSSFAGGMMIQNAALDYILNATNILKIASENYSYEANDIHKNAIENIDVSAGKDIIQNSELPYIICQVKRDIMHKLWNLKIE